MVIGLIIVLFIFIFHFFIFSLFFLLFFIGDLFFFILFSTYFILFVFGKGVYDHAPRSKGKAPSKYLVLWFNGERTWEPPEHLIDDEDGTPNELFEHYTSTLRPVFSEDPKYMRVIDEFKRLSTSQKKKEYRIQSDE